MAIQSVMPLVEALEQFHVLEPVQQQEVARLRGRFPDPAALARELLQRGWLTPFQADQLLGGRGGELALGPYLILDRLGQGAAGDVYKARLQSTRQTIALKVLRKEMLGDADVVARFHREMEVAGQLKHPCIVRASDAGQIGEVLVLEMEFIEGVDLEKLVKKSGPLPLAPACDYIRQAALGLHHAHKRGLIHRDVKPSNLIVSRCKVEDTSLIGATPWGLIKIFDLGLARLQQPAMGSATKNLTLLAGNSVMQGTPDYMAPEQAIDFHSADIRADIYSLGCTLYYLLSGKTPFTGSLTEKLMKHQAAEPLPVDRARNKPVPQAVVAVLKKMMAKVPAERFQAPGEVALALSPLIPVLSKPSASAIKTSKGSTDTPSTSGEFTFHIPDTSGRGSSVFRPPPASVSRKQWKILAGASAGIILLFLALYLLSPGKQSDSPPVAVSPTGSRPPTTAPVKPPSTAPTKSPLARAKTGEGRTFNGPGDCPEFANDLLLEPQQLTLAAWYKVANHLEGRRWIVNKNENEWKEGHYALVIDGRKVGAYLNIGGTQKDAFDVWTGEVLLLDKWHHLAMTYDGKAMKLYVDGKPAGEKAVNRPRIVPGKSTLVIGRRQDGMKDSHVQGKLDDIRIWNRPLSPEDIKTVFDRPDLPASRGQDGLIFSWP